MNDKFKPEGKKPWETGFQEQEYSQKSDLRRSKGDDPSKIINREPKKD